jgi:hypothetical protein
MVLDHRALNRMGPAEPFDGQHPAPIDAGKRQDAGIAGLDPHRAIDVVSGNCDGAGSAVTLSAALLGACQPRLSSQPVEQHCRRRRITKLDRATVQNEADGAGHGLEADSRSVIG